ncbi:GDSL esterase/lipase [Camellia lanceoleosa]|uniref:GDSL esterase/lipase n=1 Tax=Camellia lanceoleosa TaxID=1840588 RepID=A0ACC0IDT7_9ERIC|nr:GDSL esterase/lipase [Camellia lanceoleosa]
MSEVKTMLSKSLFCSSVGSNDVFVYFLTNNTMPPEQYINHLMHQYEGYIKVLQAFREKHPIELWARKFGIISVPPIGCYPVRRLHNATGDFKYVETACCGAGRLNAEILCNATANLCMNRKEYLFWDLYHETQTAAQLAAVMLYDGPPSFVTPITFRQLAEDN